ncbi:MAG: bifunctional tRNA (5-methylaminomethyl-2-thiouridine)(34)-methyltransferase MnmD/FAD-dependent 5-carboxymethylaminomethyl-2-thiouridine(34) oxidoreductase MnmC [Thiobacillaceae bacterium]
MPLTPARLAYTEDGTPYAPDYGDVYHSANGGPGQAEHVFLHGNGLPGRWRGRERFVILELGFGTGLNFLATWAAWQEDPAACTRLHYVAVEKHPFTAGDLARLHACWPQFAALSQALRERWPLLTPGLHRLEFAGGRLTLTLAFGDAEVLLPKLTLTADALYLDGFDPKKNPGLWSAGLFKRLARLAAPGATLATWCVAGGVRAALGEAGFKCEKRPGFGRKREMLTGTLGPAVQPAPVSMPAERHALVIGAGLAGAALCERLAARGWRIDLLERHDAPANEASGNLAGIVRPLVSRDDNIASRFTRAAFLASLRAWSAFDPPPRWAPCGVQQLARNPQHEASQAEAVRLQDFPEDYVRWLSRDEAADLVGWPVAQGGWFFPAGGWAQPPSVCSRMLARCGDALQARYGVEVASLRHQGGLWQALDANGGVLAAAPVLILATGTGTVWPSPAPPLPLRRVRGQVSHIPSGQLPDIRLALCREGYLTPPVEGQVCVGASYDFDDDPLPRRDSHAGNLARLAQMLPGAEAGIDAGRLQGRVGFRCVSPDRLPIVGALPSEAALDREARLCEVPRLPAAYALMGLASRGLTWAWLAAELLASQLNDEPLPLESDLAAALDPARFVLRQVRRGRTYGAR